MSDCIETYVAAIVREARATAVQAAALLRLLVGRKIEDPRPLPVMPDDLFKAAAIMWLYSWEQGGVPEHLPVSLPTSQAVLKDLASRSPQYDGKDLFQELFRVWVRYLTPVALDERLSTTVLRWDRSQDEQLLDQLARLLWDQA